MKRGACLFLAISFLTLVITGCSHASNSPANTVKSAYEAANRGDYSEASKYLSEEIKRSAEELGGSEALKTVWDKVTRNKTVKEIEIKDEIITGDEATVNFKLVFTDNSSDTDKENLRKIDGAWLIVP
jgi:hypothetical protein